MRNVLYCFGFMILISSSSAQTLTWGPEITAANGNPYGGIRPRICLVANNAPLIMWGGGTGTEPLYSAKWNGSNFNAPIMVTPANINPFIDTWAGADIASNGNTVFAVFKVQPEMTNYIYVVKSVDGGSTWSDTTRADGFSGPYSRFPSLEVTPSGNPAVVYMQFNSSWQMPEYVVTNSTDGGNTFQNPVVVSSLGGSDVCDCCPGYIFIDGTRQVVTWRRNNNNLRDMWGGLSVNNGLTFPTGMDVDPTNWMVSMCPSTGPDPFLYLDTLTTVFMSQGWSSNAKVYVSTTGVSNQTVGMITALAGNYPTTTTQNYPMIAGSGDTLGVVWQQQDGSGNMDVYFAWSVTGAAGLVNNEIVVNNNTTGTQRNPHIAYAAGKFHLTFQDAVTGNLIYKYANINGVGMDDQNRKNEFSIYPNPGTGSFKVKTNFPTTEIKSVEAFTLSGERLKLIVAAPSHFQLPKDFHGIAVICIETNDGVMYYQRYTSL